MLYQWLLASRSYALRIWQRKRKKKEKKHQKDRPSSYTMLCHGHDSYSGRTVLFSLSVPSSLWEWNIHAAFSAYSFIYVLWNICQHMAEIYRTKHWNFQTMVYTIFVFCLFAVLVRSVAFHREDEHTQTKDPSEKYNCWERERARDRSFHSTKKLYKVYYCSMLVFIHENCFRDKLLLVFLTRMKYYSCSSTAIFRFGKT